MKQSVLPRLGVLALIWGSSFLWIRLADRGFPPVEVTFARLALGAAVLFPVVVARRESLPRSGPAWAHIASLAGVVILGVLGTGVAYVLNYQIIASEGATVAATVTYLLPVVAIVLGVLALGDTVTAAAIAGIALVLAGVALTRRKPKTEEAVGGA